MAVSGEVQWFEGYDGQIVVDDSFLWITREALTDAVEFRFTTEPRRVPRSAIREVTFEVATESTRGRLAVHTDGGVAVGETGDHPDVVKFSIGSNDRFRMLRVLLTVVDGRNDWGGRSPADELRYALDTFDGIATYSELSTALGYAPDALIPVERVTWGWVRGVRTAAGGTAQTSWAEQAEKLIVLEKLAATYSLDDTTKPLGNAVAHSVLVSMPINRVAALLESLTADEPPLGALHSPRAKPIDSNPIPTDSEVSQEAADSRIPLGGGGGVESRKHLADRIAPGMRPRQLAQSLRSRLARSGKSEASTGQDDLFDGHRMRVFMELNGFRSRALFDPETTEVEITWAPYRALLGTKYVDPHRGAQAVLGGSGLGEEGPVDGWATWKLDDGSMRTLGEARETRGLKQ